LAAGAAAVVLSGCESSQQRTAELNREAAEHPVAQVEHGLTITKRSTAVRVLSTALVSSPEAAAAVVTVKNTSNHILADVPIEITVHGPRGEVLYTNNVPGLAAPLVSVTLLRPAEQFTWVDDQVQLSAGHGAHASADTVDAELGEVAPYTQRAANVPVLIVRGARLLQTAEVGEAIGATVDNTSTMAQNELVLYGVARRGGRVVAAGRAQLSSLAPGTSMGFQVPLIGSAKGAVVEVAAPPSTP
jgi:hypothetical protein